MTASKSAGRTPVWRRRWVWIALAGLVIFLAGIATSGGDYGDESDCRAASSTSSGVVGHG